MEGVALEGEPLQRTSPWDRSLENLARPPSAATPFAIQTFPNSRLILDVCIVAALLARIASSAQVLRPGTLAQSAALI